MGDYELHNEEIAVRIALLGAELKSLKDIKSGREYMWSGIRLFETGFTGAFPSGGELPE